MPVLDYGKHEELVHLVSWYPASIVECVSRCLVRSCVFVVKGYTVAVHIDNMSVMLVVPLSVSIFK